MEVRAIERRKSTQLIYHPRLPIPNIVPRYACIALRMFKRLLLRCERIQQRRYGMQVLAYTLINVQVFCGVSHVQSVQRKITGVLVVDYR